MQAEQFYLPYSGIIEIKGMDVKAMEKTITYFDKGGIENTTQTLDVAKKRVKELGIKDIVIASTHGGSALKAAEVFKDLKVNLVAVSICEGYKRKAGR